MGIEVVRLTSQRRVWTLGLVCVAIFMLVLDITIVAVALPEIQTGLRADLPSLQWVVGAYTLALAVFLLTGATLGDRIGRAPLFVAGITVFTGFSAACGLAPNVVSLDVFRGLQGIGGAVLFGIAVPLITDAYPPGRERDLALGVFGAVSGSAVAVGPLLGGLLTDLMGWRSIFWINVPIGLALLALCGPGLVRRRGERSRSIDWAGTVLVTGALCLLVLACIQGSQLGWGSPLIVGSFAGSALLGAAFVGWELRAVDPMVDLRIFADRRYSAGALVGFGLQATLVAALNYLSLYAQNVLRYSPLDTGLRILPLSVTAFAAAALVAPLLARVPAVWLVGGTAATAAAGMELLAHLSATSSFPDLLPGLLIGGVGIGMGATVLNRVAVTGVSDERTGMSSGAATAVRQVGLAVGVGVLGIVFQHVVQQRLSAGRAAAAATADALNWVMQAGAAFAAATAVVAVLTLMPVRRRPGRPAPEIAEIGTGKPAEKPLEAR